MKQVIFTWATFFACAFFVNAQSAKSPPERGASISGKVLQAIGKPLPYTEIELVPIDAAKQINDKRLLATTSLSGLFLFSNVPDGKYTLSINFDEKPSDTSPYPTFFYPNATNRSEAEVFDVDAASRVKGIVFRLPPKLAQRKITGKVVTAGGKPVTNAYVFLRDLEFENTGFSLDNVTDRNGNFTITGFETRRYVVVAVLLDQMPTIYTPPGNPIAVGKTEPFILDANNLNFTLTLKNLFTKDDVY